MMNKPKEIDYKSLYERQVKVLKILNERLRNKEKELKRLYCEMAHLRNKIRLLKDSDVDD